jgi:hypothetical protein
MSFIYVDQEQIFNNKTSKSELSHLINPNDIKQISYSSNDTFAILTKTNKIFIIIKDEPILPLKIERTDNIREISMGILELLILYESGYLSMLTRTDETYITKDLLKDTTILSIHNCKFCHIIHKSDGLWGCASIILFGTGICDFVHTTNKISVDNLYKVIVENSDLKKIFNDPEQQIKSVHCDENCCIIQYKNDEVYYFGKYGNYTSDVPIIKLIYSPESREYIKQISADKDSCLILTSNNKLWYFHNQNKTLINTDSDIYFCWIINKNIIYLKYNGEVHLMTEYSINNNNSSQLLFKNPYLTFVYNTEVNIIWTPKNHRMFPSTFKLNVVSIYLYLYLIKKYYNIKLPKYLVYIIIDFLRISL